METHFFEILRALVACLAGALIGYSFGLVQNIAMLRHEQRARAGKLKHVWSLMPGAGGRIACLLLGLALVQVICPLLFVDHTQWLVSGGLAVGYGITLFMKLRLRLRTDAS